MPTLSDAIRPCWRACPLGTDLTSLSAPAAYGEIKCFGIPIRYLRTF